MFGMFHVDDQNRRLAIAEHRSVGILDIDAGIGEQDQHVVQRPRAVRHAHHDDFPQYRRMTRFGQMSAGLLRAIDNQVENPPARRTGGQGHGPDVNALVLEYRGDFFQSTGLVFQENRQLMRNH